MIDLTDVTNGLCKVTVCSKFEYKVEEGVILKCTKKADGEWSSTFNKSRFLDDGETLLLHFHKKFSIQGFKGVYGAAVELNCLIYLPVRPLTDLAANIEVLEPKTSETSRHYNFLTCERFTRHVR